LQEQLRREGEISHTPIAARCKKRLTHAAAVPFVQDELDYEYTGQGDKEKKTSARAKAKGIKP
jgi:hypothetical protein